ncbi:uncharacterized protein LOC116167777 [Photinus pyralis]|uniref:uncharacterized protein LOC116167777 n=1 Tax=Photinus pyralis TaxID=7054 RepID=UPI0012671CFD|nr:uncharacterized protein LOC116167777 [Photinus pyralis]
MVTGRARSYDLHLFVLYSQEGFQSAVLQPARLRPIIVLKNPGDGFRTSQMSRCRFIMAFLHYAHPFCLGNAKLPSAFQTFCNFRCASWERPVQISLLYLIFRKLFWVSSALPPMVVLESNSQLPHTGEIMHRLPDSIFPSCISPQSRRAAIVISIELIGTWVFPLWQPFKFPCEFQFSYILSNWLCLDISPCLRINLKSIPVWEEVYLDTIDDIGPISPPIFVVPVPKQRFTF